MEQKRTAQQPQQPKPGPQGLHSQAPGPQNENGPGPALQPQQRPGAKLSRTKAVKLCAWVLIVGGGLFLGYKLVSYGRSAGRYNTLRDAYAPAAQSAAAQPQEAQPALNLDALRTACPQAVGWLEMPDIGLSYPIVQAQNNEFFLHHAADGTADPAGSIFLDSVNTGFDDAHVLIYGHHMQDGSMFGRLYDYRDESFYQSGTHTFTLYTKEGTRQYQIFSVQVVEEDDPVFTIGFAQGDAFDTFVQNMREGSLYNTEVEVSGEDQVVSLSTCATASGVGRIVVSGRRVA